MAGAEIGCFGGPIGCAIGAGVGATADVLVDLGVLAAGAGAAAFLHDLYRKADSAAPAKAVPGEEAPDMAGRKPPDPCKDYNKRKQDAERRYPKKAGKTEMHHTLPRYLGGENSPTVKVNAAYHQWITNEFQRLARYGVPRGPGFDPNDIARQIYEKYPLPPEGCEP